MKEVSLKIYPCFLPMLWSSNLLIQLFRFLNSTWPGIVFLVLLHIWDTTVGDRYSIYCLDLHWARLIPFCLVPSTVVKHCCYLLFLFFFCLFWLYLAYIFSYFGLLKPRAMRPVYCKSCTGLHAQIVRNLLRVHSMLTWIIFRFCWDCCKCPWVISEVSLVRSRDVLHHCI